MTASHFSDGTPLPPEPGREPERPRVLATVPLATVKPVMAVCLTSGAALPIWAGQLCAIVGEGESGKTWIAVHTASDVARGGHHVLVLDGEMSAASWLYRFRALGIDDDALGRIHYAEMAENAVDVETVRNTVAALGAKLVVWDSALSMISRTAKSENDNAEVARVYDKLREIVRNGPAGLIVDHTTRGSGTLISRGATAKFNALDVSYGVRLAEGSVPGQLDDWSSVVSVEKDRHGLLAARNDREVFFHPLGHGSLHMEITESAASTHRLTSNPTTDLIAKIAALDPPPKSANDAHNRLGGTRTSNLAAFKQWKAAQS